MSRICPICGKKPVKVTNRILLRGHYNPTSTKRHKPNLQWAILPNGIRAKICAKCKKSANK